MSAQTSLLRQLPGELVMWVLIVSELAVFCTCLLVFLALRLQDPALFAQSQDQLHRLAAGINTVVLVSSGYAAAAAVREMERGAVSRARVRLLAAGVLGLIFLGLKGVEYGDAISKGIGVETNVFFTFYFLLTGFHAAHVVAGIVILALVSVRPAPAGVQAGVQFWHMVDLVWVLLFPIIYLLQ